MAAGKRQRQLELLGLVLALGVAAIAALQPISSDELWWQLSRGRQVLLGSVQPSADLLALETEREADWLGGLPGYLLYAALGAGGLMLARLAVVIFLAWRWIAAGRFPQPPSTAADSARRWWTLLSGGLALLAISPALDPLPGLFDLLAIVLLASGLSGGPSLSGARSLASPPQADGEDRAAGGSLPLRPLLWLGLLFFAWGNLSPGIGLGAGLLLIHAFAVTALRQSPALRFGWLALLVALLAGSLNPRGLWTWIDSARQLFPAATVSPAVLKETPWVPLPSAEWGLSAVALLALTLLWLARCVATGRSEPGPLAGSRGGRRTRAAQFVLVQCLAWFSAANIPLAIAWLASDLVGPWRGNPESSGGRWLRRMGRGTLPAIGVPVATVLVLVMAALFSGRLDSVGWGIAARLDYRLFEIALAETAPHGTAFADDVRSGGMLVWTVPPSGGANASSEEDRVQLQDVPVRALVGGRLAEHQHLLEDLRTGRQTRYWRQDRSPGGFWLALQLRNTSLLCISSSRFDLVRALEPTIWKPLSLDAPVIPYARAGDAAYAEQLLAVLRFRQLVDLEPWNYVIAPSSGSEFDRDFFGLRDSAGSEAILLRQARTFRAMELYYAALRVLFVGRQRWPESVAVTTEIRHCQGELAHRERRLAGQASWLRDWAAQSSEVEEVEPREPPRLGKPTHRLATRTSDEADRGTELGAEAGEAARPEAADAEAKQELLAELQVYWAAGPQAALQSALERGPLAASPNVSPHPQLAYAWLCWAIESGQHDLAGQLARALSARFEAVPPETPGAFPANLRLLVQYRMEDLGLLPERQGTAAGAGDTDEEAEQ